MSTDLRETDAVDDFAGRLRDVRRRIAAACERAGRDVNDVNILPVGKKHGPERIAELVAAGLTVCGENRVQEAQHKIPLCSGELEWHMIGHLQRNKVRAATAIFSMIHSIDSAGLAEAVDGACGEGGKTLPVCLQVNVSGERSKSGMAPEETQGVLDRCRRLMNIDVVGLMTIPPFSADPREAAPFFAQLRALRDQLRESTGFPLENLSMGMSNDFEVAIEEGATWVRLGSVLFGRRGEERDEG